MGGVITGCLFSLLWLKALNLNPLRLTTLGILTLGVYLNMFYTNASAEFDFLTLRPLIMLRSFAYAAISIPLMVILHDIMPFQIFFMGLSVFNMFHMIVGGVAGAAAYSHGLEYYMTDYLSRYAEYFDHIALSSGRLGFGEKMEFFERGLMIMSVKQIYGWVAYLCLTVGLVMFLFKVPLIRKGYRQMKSWKAVSKTLRRRIRREDKSIATAQNSPKGAMFHENA